jgi:hypothetical protein
MAMSMKMAASSSLIALMMEAVQTSETLVNLYQSTWYYNPQDSHLRNVMSLRLINSKKSTWASLEDPTVQLTMKMLRQAFIKSTRRLQGNVPMRLVSLKPAFITFCSMRSGNRMYQNCSMQ